MHCIDEIFYNPGKSRHLYQMAIVSKKDTGLPYDILIDSAGKDRRPSHGPRVRVDVDGKGRRMPEITISDKPEIKKGTVKTGSVEIIKWIQKYYDILMKHYNKEITDREALNLLMS